MNDFNIGEQVILKSGIVREGIPKSEIDKIGIITANVGGFYYVQTEYTRLYIPNGYGAWTVDKKHTNDCLELIPKIAKTKKIGKQ